MPAKPKPRYHKTKRSWYFVHNGKQRSLGSDEGKAWAQFRELTGAEVSTDKPASVAALVIRWLELKPDDHEQNRLSRWLRFAGPLPLDGIDVDHLGRFVAFLATVPQKPGSNHKTIPKVGYAPKTIRDTLNSTKRVLQWCIDYDWIDRMPRLPSVPKAARRPKDLDQDQLESAWATLPKYAKPILTFILEVGCRPGEACRLDWNDVDLEKGMCTLGEHKMAHRGRMRVLGIPSAARQVLDARPRRDGPVFLSRLGTPYTVKGLRTILRRRGIDSVYSLRHTRAQRMLEEGYSAQEIAAWLGHADLSTVSVYAQVRAEQVRAVAVGLKPILPEDPH